MGNVVERSYYEPSLPKTVPDTSSAPTYPPEYGFDFPRKERVSHFSEREMKAMKLEKHVRDYCAHYLVPYYACMRKKTPFFLSCRAELHQYHACQYEDFVLRMKEYERERRLRVREEAAA